MTEYCLGFAFRGDNVVLLRKTKPHWQRGRLNGVGGKIEPGETPGAAMVREFREETGVDTDLDRWEKFTVMTIEPDVKVYCFSYVLREGEDCRTTTDEQVHFVPFDMLTVSTPECIENLIWLVPMAHRSRFFGDRVPEDVIYCE